MRLEKDYKRPIEVNEPSMNAKYYENMKRWDQDFTGQWFDAEVVYAATRFVSYKDKKKPDVLITTEILRLALKLNNTDSFTEADVWGARTRSDKPNEEGHNPVQLQDLLYLCVSQKPNALDDAYDYSNDYNEGTVYPHLCGCKFKLLAALVGKDKTGKYDRNRFAFFAPDGRSAVEIQGNVPADQKQDIKNELAKLKAEYQKYISESGATPAPAYGSMNTPAPAATPAPAPVQPAPAAKQSEPLDDDIPF